MRATTGAAVGANTNGQLNLRLSWSLPIVRGGTLTLPLSRSALFFGSALSVRVGSFFQRVAAALGSDGDNTAIQNFRYNISGQAGSLDVPFTAQSAFGACQGEQRMYWALFTPAGVNALGQDLGYDLDPKYRPPPLLYNCDSKCASGGHVPPAGTQGLCATARWGTLDTTTAGSTAGSGRPPLAVCAYQSAPRVTCAKASRAHSRAL